MPRRSRVERRGTVLLGAGMTLPHADMPPDGPGSRQKASGAMKTTTEPSGGAEGPLSAVYEAMAEAEFQNYVESGLRQRGYHVFHVPDMRRTEAGLTDVVAVGPIGGPGPVRLLLFELKTQRGRIRPGQQAVIDALGLVTVIDARIIRPDGWNAILAELDR